MKKNLLPCTLNVTTKKVGQDGLQTDWKIKGPQGFHIHAKVNGNKIPSDVLEILYKYHKAYADKNDGKVINNEVEIVSLHTELFSEIPALVSELIK